MRQYRVLCAIVSNFSHIGIVLRTLECVDLLEVNEFLTLNPN